MRWLTPFILLLSMQLHAQVDRLLPLLGHHIQSETFQDIYGYSDRTDLTRSFKDAENQVTYYLESGQIRSMVFESAFPYEFKRRNKQRRVERCVEKEAWKAKEGSYFHENLYYDQVYIDPDGREVGFHYQDGRLLFIEVQWPAGSDSAQDTYVVDSQYFADQELFKHYVTYREDPHFFYFDPNGAECLSGDCENGNGSLRWANGKTFKGTIRDGQAVEGEFGYRDARFGRMTLKGRLKDHMLHGVVDVSAPMKLLGKVEMQRGLAHSTTSLNYPFDHQYIGRLSPDFQPMHEEGVWSLYTFMDGVTAEVTLRKEHSYKDEFSNYAKIDYQNGYRYEGFIDEEFRRWGLGTIFDDGGKRSMSTLFYNDTIDGRNKNVVWEYDQGLTQSGIYTLAKGFNGSVVSKVTNLNGTFVVEGTYKDNQPVGVHSLRDDSRNILMGTGTYVDGTYRSGMDVYGDPDQGLLFQVGQVAGLPEDFEFLRSELRKQAQDQGWEIKLEKEFTAQQGVILHVGTEADVYYVKQRIVNVVILDMFSRSTKYYLNAHAFENAYSKADYPSANLLPDPEEPRMYKPENTYRTDNYSNFHFSVSPADPSKKASKCVVFVLTKRQ